ncbi:putative Pentatricopeptide repeat-containing protein [Zostera marina]|uniref:Putative Pentatricopeptide repeat-containing protein n=1 Tax=Zostera marina TaxID=29655 RepID=A0A0K9NSW8_ZOSMR|nr:putative Pentatricopeptide repeat-containing protein [Zostera marina]
MSLLFRSSCRRIFPRLLSTTTTTATTNTSEASSNLSTMVRSLFREQDNDVLVARFNEFSSTSYHFRCKSEVYHIIIRRLASAGRKDSISKILEAQKLIPDVKTHQGFAGRIISLYGKAKMADEAESTFYQLPRTVQSFNTLLSAFNDAGEPQRAIDALNSIPLSKDCEEIVPDIYSYNIFMHAMCLKSDMEAAVEYLDTMETKQVEPNVVTYCTIMSGYYRHGRIEDAEKVWEIMKVKNCSPDVKCYNSKIKALCSASENRISEAEELIEVMKNTGLEPNGYSYTCLIIYHCKAGVLKNAKKVFEEMRKRNCEPNRITYEALIPKLCEAEEFGPALKLCNLSVHKRLGVSAEVLQAVADGLAGHNNVDEAKKLVKFAWSSSTPKYSGENLKMPPACLTD